MDATVVSDAVSVVGMLGATVDFNDVDELDLRAALIVIVGAKAEVLAATAAKIATTLTEVEENFIVLLWSIFVQCDVGAIMQLFVFFDHAE